MINEIPQYRSDLVKHLYTYNETMKTFLKKTLSRIPYFHPEYMNQHLFHTILYSLEQRYHKPGDLLLKVQDDTTSVYIVTHGCLEMYTEFEGNEFILETLTAGSILNYRVLFTDE